jgi:hypothetical protein
MEGKEEFMNQRTQIIKYLEEFGSITSYEAYIDLGVTQLSTRLSELKEQGYYFTYEIEVKKNRYGKKVRFKRYKLGGTHENIV